MTDPERGRALLRPPLLSQVGDLGLQGRSGTGQDLKLLVRPGAHQGTRARKEISLLPLLVLGLELELGLGLHLAGAGEVIGPP